MDKERTGGRPVSVLLGSVVTRVLLPSFIDQEPSTGGVSLSSRPLIQTSVQLNTHSWFRRYVNRYIQVRLGKWKDANDKKKRKK